MNKLSVRLEAVANYVDDNSKVIDIGCDHGFLSIFLAKKYDNIKIIGVEPSGCPYYSKQLIGKYNIPGIGTTFMPSIVDMSLIDDMMEITDEDAKKYMEILAKEEGILAGYSSGAVLAGTIKYLKTNKISNKIIVMIFHDTGERYLSML